MIRFFQLALWLCHWKTPAAEKLLRQVTTLPRFVLAEKVAGLKKWVRKSPHLSRRGVLSGAGLLGCLLSIARMASFASILDRGAAGGERCGESGCLQRRPCTSVSTGANAFLMRTSRACSGRTNWRRKLGRQGSSGKRMALTTAPLSLECSGSTRFLVCDRAGCCCKPATGDEPYHSRIHA